MAVKRGGRVIAVGDDRQAIYGFRGADSNSLDRLKRELNAKELTLTITYRCPKKIVESVQHLVPDYQAAPNAPDGIFSTVGDFVLSRKNAPLAQMCLKFLKNRKRARIEGKETGRQLVNLVKKFKASTFEAMFEKLLKWEERECAKLLATGKESAKQRIELIHDQADCIRALSEDLERPSDLVTRIEELFQDTAAGANDFIRCSSVHRSKGLETDRVWLLTETLYPGGRTEVQEEKNIEYVARTRAKKELVEVTGLNPDGPMKKVNKVCGAWFRAAVIASCGKRAPKLWPTSALKVLASAARLLKRKWAKSWSGSIRFYRRPSRATCSASANPWIFLPAWSGGLIPLIALGPRGWRGTARSRPPRAGSTF
jgi:ATP-dependent exoDNAse (exonuclease V) beta subunit